MKNKRLLFALMAVLSMSGFPAWADDDVAARCELLHKKEDYKKALAPCKQAAEQGNAVAQFNLGRMHYYGEGVQQNYKKAAKWYRLSAEQGYAKAQNNLGLMYDKGEGVQRDYKEAAKWYRLAAEQGDVLAQLNLGVMYVQGEGVGLDKKREAVKWFRLAAEQGDVLAQYNLGVTYDNGWGVQQDYKEATKWFRLAAEQGHAKAQYNLGVTYYSGEGVIQNYKEAYIWFSLAAVGGYEEAKKSRDLTAGLLNASEIHQAKREAERRLAAIESKNNTAETFGIPELRQPAINPAAIAFENGWRSVVVIKTTEGQGSGVIIRPNLVATNCHVVDDGEEIIVYKANNRRAETDSAHDAKIHKRDSERDLCLLDVKGLWGVPANIRRADTLSVGENVYAIGAPKGLEYTMSAGIVSQLRSDGGEAPIIQTDTAISPGSSGGGLFDGEGNLVGITTIKFVDEDTEGISFAIPADWILELR